jgi:nucleotide-binding universal stress UspA family protein
MVEIKKIAVPIDFTDVAPFVAKYAKEFAKKLDAEIVLIYILEDLSAYEGLYVDAKTLTELEGKLIEGARTSMEEFVKEHFSDYSKVKTLIEKGDVVEGIIEAAKKEGADLIVIGTHGRKGLDKILFGSVAEGVIKNSPIPVLSLNPHRMERK